MKRHRSVGVLFSSALCRVQRRHHAVRLGRAADVQNRLRQGYSPLRQPYVLKRGHSRHSHYKRLRVGKSNVLRSMYDNPARKQHGLAAAFYQSVEPKARRVAVAAAHTLDKRRNHVVIALSVHAQRLFLHLLRGDFFVYEYFAVGVSRSRQHGKLQTVVRLAQISSRKPYKLIQSAFG